MGLSQPPYCTVRRASTGRLRGPRLGPVHKAATAAGEGVSGPQEVRPHPETLTLHPGSKTIAGRMGMRRPWAPGCPAPWTGQIRAPSSAQ